MDSWSRLKTSLLLNQCLVNFKICIGLWPSYFGGFATYHKTFFWPVYMIKYIMFNTKNEKLGGYEVGSREHRILNFEVPKMWDRIWGTSTGRRKNSNIFLNSLRSEFFRYGGGISEFGSILELWIMTHFCKNDMSHSICIRIYALYISFEC